MNDSSDQKQCQGMRNVGAFYRPPEYATLEEAMKSGWVALDANILLDLWRFCEYSRERLLETFKLAAGSIFLPHQVVEEFYKNRRAALAGAKKEEKEAKDKIAVQISELKSILGNHANRTFAQNEDREGYLKSISTLENAVENFFTAASRGDISAEPQGSGEDSISISTTEVLEEIFKNNVGKELSAEERALFKAEFLSLEKKGDKPVGYKDLRKVNNDEGVPEGDYLIWKELINEAKRRNGAPLIWVTNDNKEDWVWGDKNKRELTLQPRLAKFFEIETGAQIYIIKLATFLKLANEVFSVGLEEETLENAAATDISPLSWASDTVAAIAKMNSISDMISKSPALKNLLESPAQTAFLASIAKSPTQVAIHNLAPKGWQFPVILPTVGAFEQNLEEDDDDLNPSNFE